MLEGFSDEDTVAPDCLLQVRDFKMLMVRMSHKIASGPVEISLMVTLEIGDICSVAGNKRLKSCMLHCQFHYRSIDQSVK